MMGRRCYTRLTIAGDENHRRDFRAKNKGFAPFDFAKEGSYKDLSFHEQVPIPKKLLALRDDYLLDKWYLKNWGCWVDNGQPESCLIFSHSAIVEYVFKTVGSCPYLWAKKASKKFPQLEFSLEWAVGPDLAGMTDGGKLMYKGGDIFYEVKTSRKQQTEHLKRYL